MNLPGFRFHALFGRDKGRYAVMARVCAVAQINGVGPLDPPRATKTDGALGNLFIGGDDIKDVQEAAGGLFVVAMRP